MKPLSIILAFAVVALAVTLSHAASNELRILAITPQTNGQVTLRWASQPGEYYAVYSTDALADWTIWRLAAARIPSAGTNTSWTDESSRRESP
jgi:hypothetical protein